ncbi:MAG: polyphosphate kinase 1 [Flavobacteriaceae bacterium]|nr:polyphosphate kinase 1 [Flavobacteriaceae bacterium]
MTENRFVNREISWLDFNARVLQEAKDENVPLIDRLRFIGIFSNNLDEFYKVRYATVKRIARVEEAKNKVFGDRPAEVLLQEITQKTIDLQKESLEILNSLHAALEKENIFFVNETEVNEEQQVFINTHFSQEIGPSLVTLMLNDIQSISRIKDSNAYLAVRLELVTESHPYLDPVQYALIEIPSSLNRFVVLPSVKGKTQVMMLDDLIRTQLSTIFDVFQCNKMEAHMVKFSRDAELDIDDDFSKSYVEKVAESVKDRSHGEAVRFVYDKEIAEDTLSLLLNRLEIDNRDSVINGGRYHNRRDYMNFPDLGRTDLRYQPLEPLPIVDFDLNRSMFSQIAVKDRLMATPYHSFAYLVKFLREAAIDPKVKSISITIYRLSKLSNVASSLVQAARNGKRVTVQIELQARFDEAANIRYAEEMKKEGIRLIFGVPGLKVHSKICIVHRLEGDKLKLYGIVSTGNFNESTAKLYTDYTLFTAYQPILKEVDKVFQFLDASYRINKYKHLVISPHKTASYFTSLIKSEIKNVESGKKGMIRLKMNSLTNYSMVESLYNASRSGVKIQLIIRGVCCLIPGVKGMSENIEVISVVDKFLEHTRLMIFENDGNPHVFISSADWMTRNIENRVEVSCPIYDAEIKSDLIANFWMTWNDNAKARILNGTTPNMYKSSSDKRQRSQIEIYNHYKNKLSLED